MNSIGIKKLSDADLGKSKSSNQTHIGLNRDAISYSSDLDNVILNCNLIYKNSSIQCVCYLDYVFRSGKPMEAKIRKGNKNIAVSEKSVLELIRELCFEKDETFFISWTLVDTMNIHISLFGKKDNPYIYLIDDISIQKKIKNANFNITIGSKNNSYNKIKRIFDHA